MKLHVVQDGIKNVGWIILNGKQVFNTNFHLLTYNFKTNEGYIDKKCDNYWRLYTQIGQKIGQSRYHKLKDFEQCIEKLKDLKGDNDIVVCKSKEVNSI